MNELQKEFGYKEFKMIGNLNVTSGPTRSELMSIADFTHLSNCFRMTKKFVPNDKMLDGNQKLVLFKVI